MCFPKMKQCFCCCSLKTGMFFICWISLLWNLYFLYIVEREAPEILKFLDEQNVFHLPNGQSFSDFKRVYYVTQIMVMTLALIGVYSNSICCLNILIISETIILLMYVFMTLHKVNACLIESAVGANNSADPVLSILISAFKYYLYLIILSFHNDISNGGDGRGRGGIVIATTVASPFAPASAPSAMDHNLANSSYLESPYAIQPPHAPIITQPCTAMYPPSDFPHVVVQTNVAPCAPPPYPMPQPVVMNEKPPPYAP